MIPHAHPFCLEGPVRLRPGDVAKSTPGAQPKGLMLLQQRRGESLYIVDRESDP